VPTIPRVLTRRDITGQEVHFPLYSLAFHHS
jgi:hypothetical protein